MDLQHIYCMDHCNTATIGQISDNVVHLDQNQTNKAVFAEILFLVFRMLYAAY